MEFNKLLSKQINKYLPSDLVENEDIKLFLNAINNSYQSFERDKQLSDHSFKMSEQEFIAINKQLQSEIYNRNLGIQKLIDTIKSMELLDEINLETDEKSLNYFIDYLEVQIENRKIAEVALIKAKNEAERAANAKSDFLSLMSHELRTPLNAVIGFTYLLKNDNPSPSQIEYLEPLSFSADNLLALINDILDFSKIESGKIEFESIEFDLKKFLQSIKSLNQLKANENGNSLKLIIDDDIPEMIVGDSYRLGQILNNLINNAIKFTENGTITVSLDLKKLENNVATIEFSVKDTGIGIEEKNLVKIFDQFTQAQTDVSRKYGGSGLGLAITSRLLLLQNSILKVRSKINEGSIFYFALDFYLANASSQKVTEKFLIAEEFKSLENVKILLVEDNPINIKLGVKFLSKWKSVPDIAINGLEALNKVKTNNYDIVIMDLHMPIMDGFTATREIRNFNKTIPIIALSAVATIDVKDKVIAYGMNDYITKPFNHNDLFEKIKNIHRKFT